MVDTKPLTGEILKSIVPTLRFETASRYADLINGAMLEAQIKTPRQKAAFIASIAHESAGLARWVENLYYSAERIVEVWPTRFASIDDARPYAMQPEKLANSVYAQRMGNGPSSTGNGYRYRGRGPLMLTGKDNYAAAERDMGIPLTQNPSLAAEPEYGFRIAAWFWRTNGLNELAEAGDFKAVTKKINGGLVGYKDRYASFVRGLAALGGAQGPVAREQKPSKQ